MRGLTSTYMIYQVTCLTGMHTTSVSFSLHVLLFLLLCLHGVKPQQVAFQFFTSNLRFVIVGTLLVFNLISASAGEICTCDLPWFQLDYEQYNIFD